VKKQESAIDYADGDNDYDDYDSDEEEAVLVKQPSKKEKKKSKKDKKGKKEKKDDDDEGNDGESGENEEGTDEKEKDGDSLVIEEENDKINKGAKKTGLLKGLGLKKGSEKTQEKDNNGMFSKVGNPMKPSLKGRMKAKIAVQVMKSKLG